MGQFRNNLHGICLAYFLCLGSLLLPGCNAGSSGGWLGAKIEATTQRSIHKPIVPSEGVYLGALLPDGQVTIASFNSQSGIKHAIFGDFFRFPDCIQDGKSEQGRLGRFVQECRDNGAMAMLTIETFDGFASYTASDTEKLAAVLFYAELPVYLRWNQEMNGSWYPWGQQPAKYIRSFREVADVIHRLAPNVAMTWTPNQGWGYPWSAGNYAVSPGSSDFSLLDTDRNLIIDDKDDPYSPYYPGDDAVDWVGFSFYQWSNRLERGINEIPANGRWGEANGVNNSVINFHSEFAVKGNKPMMIAETAAFYDSADTKGGGADEAAIKKEWIKQVYNYSDPGIPGLTKDFPLIKAIFWFNQEKFESETASTVDWRISFRQDVRDYYRNFVQASLFLKGTDVIFISE